MADKCSIDKFDSTLERLLDKYGEEINAGVKETTEAVAKATAKMVRSGSSSNFAGTGKYAKGWSQKLTDSGHLSTVWTVYNKDHYQLAHLLEHGHALVQGGRRKGSVNGREHIAPAEEYASEQLQKKIEILVRKA